MRIVWNASSTLEESNADVSKKDNPYFSLNAQQHREKLNCVKGSKCGKKEYQNSKNRKCLTIKFSSLLEKETFDVPLKTTGKTKC